MGSVTGDLVRGGEVEMWDGEGMEVVRAVTVNYPPRILQV